MICKEIQRLARLDACALSDALDRCGLAGAVSGLESKILKTKIFGRVRTVKLASGPQPASKTKHLGTSAIERADSGDVIVVEQRTGVDAAGWGGILSNSACVKGIAGVIVDGPARDIDEAASIGFPLYSRAATARTARGRVYEHSSGEPVKIGDVVVREGDYVLADSSGVVFVSQERIDEVLALAETLSRRENAMTKSVLRGDAAGSVMGVNYETMLER